MTNELDLAGIGARAALSDVAQGFADSDRPEMLAIVEDATADIDALVGIVGRTGSSEGLVPLRHDYFDAIALRQAARDVGDEGSRAVETALADARGHVERAVASARQRVEAVTRAMRYGVAILGLAGLLGCAFAARRAHAALQKLRAKNDELERLRDDLVSANAHLEERVEERTEELRKRESSTRLLLDSTGDGMIEIDAEGRAVGECSRAMHDRFGREKVEAESTRLWDLLCDDDMERDMFAMSWEQLADDFLPFELAVEQLPQRIERGERTFELAYRRTDQDTFLVVVRDGTARVAAERAERAAREHHAVMASLIANRSGFQVGIDECESLLSRLESGADDATRMRDLHTLKGGAACLGFASFAAECHDLETRIEVEKRPIGAPDVEALNAAWDAALEPIRELLPDEERGASLSVGAAEVEDLLERVRADESWESIASLAGTWALPSDRTYTERLVREGQRLGASLGKEVDVLDRSAGLRVPESLGHALGTLTHLVRNAVDHGIEAAADRVALGKPARGLVRVETRADGDHLVVTVTDDGRGLDREALVARAGEEFRDASLLDLVTREGVSTASEVTEVSGRGVGMGAVLEALADIDGEMSIESTPGEGTSVSVRIPLGLAASAA